VEDAVGSMTTEAYEDALRRLRAISDVETAAAIVERLPPP
jgi:hypothetical protein